jgi:AcrR family transcriptional regulator
MTANWGFTHTRTGKPARIIPMDQFVRPGKNRGRPPKSGRPENILSAEAPAPISRPPGRPKGGDSGDTAERILDAAETLFASHGFHGVTLRQIAALANVDAALASYHFGAKRDLFDAVFLRRAAPLNEERLNVLAATIAKAAPAPAAVADIVDAFVRPVLLRWARGGPGWKSYCALVAQVNNTPEWGGETMHRYFDPTVQKFIAALRHALPGHADVDLYWCYHFLSGALTLTIAETGRLDRLSNGQCQSGDVDAVLARLAPFMAAGFKAIGG